MTSYKFVNPVFNKGMQQTTRIDKKPLGRFFNILDKQGNKMGQAFVYMTEEYRIKDLPDNVISMNHDPECRTRDGLAGVLQKYHPDSTADSVVVVIWFSVIRGELL